MGKKGCSKIQNNKLNTYDWLCDVPDAANATDYVEVQFKNTRKGYYLNSSKIPLEKGDLVAVEASPGHDIGTVTLTGKLVLLQMKKNNVRTGEGNEPKKVYRKAKPTDIEKYEEAKAKEHATMIRSRQIAADLGLNMKIGMFNSAGFSLLLSQEKSAASCTFLGNPTLLKTGANDPISLSPVIKSSLPFAPVLNTTNA